MRRNALSLLSVAPALLLCGCSLFGAKKGAEMQPAETAIEPVDFYTTMPVEEPVVQPIAPVETYVDHSAPSEPRASAFADAARIEVRGSQYHVVAKRDTLYALARRYYGDQRRWKEIYEANRNEIGDPNMIKIGQQLVIP